jgi:hypothetical protein
MIIVDTGYFVALADIDDAHHARASTLAGSLSEGWITTWPVLTETCAILPVPCTKDFLTFVERGGASAVDLPGEAVTTIRSLMHNYSTSTGRWISLTHRSWCWQHCSGWTASYPWIPISRSIACPARSDSRTRSRTRSSRTCPNTELNF